MLKSPAYDGISEHTFTGEKTMSAVLVSTLTCPSCGRRSQERMPTDACLYFWDCPWCGVKLKPKSGDCCVFCSYGDVPCPPMQDQRSCGNCE